MPDRREFLKQTSSGIAAATVLTGTTALGAKSANDKLVVGLIGCGGRGVHDAGLFKQTPNVEVAYVSDVDESRRHSCVMKRKYSRCFDGSEIFPRSRPSAISRTDAIGARNSCDTLETKLDFISASRSCL